MPKEYRSTGGPASPNPSGFGSADLNLTTPRFVAQTNVAAPENQYDVLQKILGMATQVGGQLLQYKTADIQGQISYDKAIEAKQEREEVAKRRAEADEDRKQAKAAQAFRAEEAMKLAKVETPEEAKALRAALLAGVSEDDSPEMLLAKAQGAQSAESEARQREADTDKSLISEANSLKENGRQRILTAVSSGDVEELNKLHQNFLTEAEQETDTRKKNALLDLATQAYGSSKILENEAEQEAAKAKAASLRTARLLFGMKAQDVIAERGADLKALSDQFENVTDDALARAVYDSVLDGILKDDQLGFLALTMDKDEQLEVSSAIYQETQSLVGNIVSERNRKKEREAFENRTATLEYTATKNVGSAFNQIQEDVTLTDAQKAYLTRAAATAYINAQTSDIDRLKATEDVLSYMDNNASIVAAREQRKVFAKIAEAAQLERTGTVATQPSIEGEFNVGWLTKYQNREQFLDTVLRRYYGATFEDFQTNEATRRLLGEPVNDLIRQWDRDTESRNANLKEHERALNALDREARRLMKPEEFWNQSPLAEAIRNGTHSNMSQGALDEIMKQSIAGFADTTMPSALKKLVVDQYDNPHNFSLVASYWRVMNAAEMPTARNMAIDSPEVFKSYALGMYLNTLDIDVDPNTAQNLGVEMTRNLAAMSTDKKDSSTDSRVKEIRRRFASLMTGNAGIDTGWFDFTGEAPKNVIGLLPPGDQDVVFKCLAAASCAPLEGGTGELAARIMRSSGYRIYPVTNDSGTVSFQLIQNVPAYRQVGAFTVRTTPLPEPEVLESTEWSLYLYRKKPAIAEVLNKLPRADAPGSTEQVYTADNIEEVRIAPYDADIKQGRVGLRVKSGGNWMHVPSAMLSVNAEDFAMDVAASKKARSKPFAEHAKDNNPWIPDVWESLFK